MDKKGFSLFEFCIYCFFLTLITTYIIRFTHKSYIRYRTQMGFCTSVTDVALALDLLLRDLRSAPSLHTQWDIEVQKITWKHSNHTITWGIKNSCLVRIQDAHTSVVAQNIQDLSFKAKYKKQHIKKLEITVQFTKGDTTPFCVVYSFHGSI